MRRLINYIRSCFCKHDWENLGQMNIFNEFSDTIPYERRITYRCKKCGYTQRVKL